VEKKSKISLTNYCDTSNLSIKEASTATGGTHVDQIGSMEMINEEEKSLKSEENLNLCDRIRRAKMLAKSAKELISTPIPSRPSELHSSESTLKEEDTQIWSQSSFLKNPQNEILNFESRLLHNSNHFNAQPSQFGSSNCQKNQQNSKKMELKGFPSFSW